MTTIELPDDLVRQVKARATREGRRVADLVAELLRAGLGKKAAYGGVSLKRGELPVVKCKHPAPPGEEMTPERVAEALWGPEE
jgi:hypothetical protein